MNTLIICTILCYIVASGTIIAITIVGGLAGSSPNKTLVYFVISFLFGWLIIPIMFVLGLKEIYDEWKERANQ